ncbi:MAG: prepilin peptidase [Candidatus Blackburnbacteria bacterium]|nr:prepilin peptidase [Candidatus Blackburnbacteria bacterium]
MLLFYFYFFLLVIGLVMGSFISMLTWRLPRGISLRGRSVCDKCHKKINWYHNIPVVSYFLLSGKCANCGKHIGLRYLLIEVTTSALYVLAGYLWLHSDSTLLHELSANTPVFSSLVILLLLLTAHHSLLIVDLEHKLLPDVLTLMEGVIILLILLTLPSPQLFQHLFWGFLSFLFFLSIFLITRGRGMGFGDVKLVFVLGSWLGFPYLLVWLFLSFTLGAITGILLLIFKKAHWGYEIAFGPFLLAASLVTFFLGDNIIRWYTALL